MGNVKRNTMTDEELRNLDIKIPEEETDESFFGWLEEMLDDVFKDIKPVEENE